MATNTVSLSVGKLALVFATLIFACQTAYPATRAFSVKSLKGCYVASMYGHVIPNPKDPSIQLPQSTIFRFCANGKGKATVKSRWNIAGLCNMQQKGTVRYSVSSTGIGSATAVITVTSVTRGCATLQPPILVDSKARFRYQMVLDGHDCMEVLATELLADLTGARFLVPIVGHGHACKQQR